MLNVKGDHELCTVCPFSQLLLFCFVFNSGRPWKVPLLLPLLASKDSHPLENCRTAEHQRRTEQLVSKWWLCSILSIGSIVNNVILTIIIMLNSTSSSQWWLTLSTASPTVVTRRNKHIFNLCQLILDWAASCWDKLFCFHTTAILKSFCWLSRFNLGNYPKSPHSGMLWSGLCLDLGWNWEMLVGSFLICNSKYQEAQRRVSHCFKKLQ